MTSANLEQWILHPEVLNHETLYEIRTLLMRYPYFQTLRLLYLKNLYLLHDITFGVELRKAALYVGDRGVLFYLIEGDKYALRTPKKTNGNLKTQEEELCLDRTLSLIDAFLSTIPKEEVSQTTFDYSTDYVAYSLENNISDSSLEDAPKLRGFELIDGFIEKSESESTVRLKPLLEEFLIQEKVSDELVQEESQTDDNEEDDSCFTETLAKIYIKQRRYSKALEIIKKLNLKYPKKNAYFADQIRFLEKLIINAKSK